MAFNYYTGFITGYSSIVVIPPRFTSRSIIPNNLPSPLLNKYSPSFDYTMTNRFIRAVNSELFANDVFWLDCNEKKAKNELMKLWALFRSSAINYVLTVPLTWGYYDFPQFTLQKNASNPKQLDFVLSSDASNDIKSMRLVFVDVFQDFKRKTITASVEVHDTLPCPFAILDDDGVAHFTHNFAYFISGDKTTYQAPYKTKYGAYLCTQSVWFGRYFGNKDYTLIKAMKPFSNAVVASGAIDNTTGSDLSVVVKPIINKSMVEYIRSQFSRRASLLFRGMSASDFTAYFNATNSALLNASSQDSLLKYIAICDGSNTDATFYLASSQSTFLSFSYPKVVNDLDLHINNSFSVKWMKFAYKGSYYHDSAINQDFIVLNEVKYINYGIFANQVTQFWTLDVSDIKTGGLLFLWDDGFSTGASVRHALVVEFGLDGTVSVVIPNGTTTPYHFYSLQFSTDVSYKYDFFVAFLSAVYNATAPFCIFQDDFSQFLAYYTQKNQDWISGTFDSALMPRLCDYSILDGLHFGLSFQRKAKYVDFYWNALSYTGLYGGVTFYIFTSDGINNFSASSDVKFRSVRTYDYRPGYGLTDESCVGQTVAFENCSDNIPYLVTVLAYLNSMTSSTYGHKFVSQFSAEFVVKSGKVSITTCNCVTRVMRKGVITLPTPPEWRISTPFNTGKLL